MLEKEKDLEKDIFGDYDFENFNNIYSIGTGRNETGADSNKNNNNFEKIEGFEALHYQTELNKSNQKTKEKNKFKHKNSFAGNSSKELEKILQKKKFRNDKERTKKKKTKSEMEFTTLKNETEINYEEKKKENQKRIFEMYNQENFTDFNDVYEEMKGSGDLFDHADIDFNEEVIPEVNKTSKVYKTELNNKIPESLKMFISSEIDN